MICFTVNDEMYVINRLIVNIDSKNIIFLFVNIKNIKDYNIKIVLIF